MPLSLSIVIPFLTATLTLLMWKHAAVQRCLGVVGGFALLAAASSLTYNVSRYGMRSEQLGNWPAPYGITLVADHLSTLMILVTGIIAAAVSVYSLGARETSVRSFMHFPLLNMMLMGVNGSFLTGDIFNLFVWFEVQLLASFVLLSLEGERPQMEGTIKYVALNLLASVLLLSACGLLYGLVGSLNMAHIAQLVRQQDDPRALTGVALLFLTAFGIKAAIFPLFFWLPAAYHTPPPVVSAVFAGLLTKTGVYALIRVFTLMFVEDARILTLLLVLSGLTMITGVLGAVAQSDVRRILSFHIISQIGYMVMGLALYTRLALAGAVFYIVHHIIVKTNLFLVGGIVETIQGTSSLEKSGGFYRLAPGLSITFMISALSLAGVPPLSGFVAKLILVRAGLETGNYAIVAVALGVSLLTLYSMSKIWTSVFWSEQPDAAPPPGERVTLSVADWGWLWVPTILLAAVTLFIGACGTVLFELSDRAAVELLSPELYIQHVLGETP